MGACKEEKSKVVRLDVVKKKDKVVLSRRKVKRVLQHAFFVYILVTLLLLLFVGVLSFKCGQLYAETVNVSIVQ